MDLTTAIDFNPYKDALSGVNQYILKVRQSLTRYSESFYSSDPRYSFLLNMTIDVIDSVYMTLPLPKWKHST